MKKFICFILAFTIFGFMSSEAKTTKKTGNKRSTTSSLVVTKGETKHYGDYLTTQFFTVKKGKNKQITIEYPIGGDPLLVGRIRDYYIDILNNKFSGSLETPEELLKSNIDFKDIAKASSTDMEQETKIIYSSPNVVTFLTEGYVQEDGMYYPYVRQWGESFLVENGYKLSSLIKPEIESIYPYMIDNIDEDDWIVSDYKKDLYNYGFGGYFYMTEKGLTFCEFIGMDSGLNANGGIIEGSIPRSQIYNIVSKDVQEFLK